MTTDNRMAGEVAIVGVGYSPLARNSGKSVTALALMAGKQAIDDAGLRPSEIDGVGGVFSLDQPTAGPAAIAEGLGISRATWTNGTTPPSLLPVIHGAAAVHAGLCRYALIVHAKYRWDSTSSSAASDPLRKAPFPSGYDPGMTGPYWRPYKTIGGMPGLMRRHMHEFGSTRDDFGLIAVNNRTNAMGNPRAVFRTPITREDYANAPMIADPFCLLDMDMPIDGAMAVILTTRERAADLPKRPVYIEAATFGLSNRCDLSGNQRLEEHVRAYEITGEELWRSSGLKPSDVDVMNIYDGFSILTMMWLEAVVCGKGNGAAFLRDAWNEDEQRLKFWGRVPMSTHGGNLSEGRVQGFGHVTEAVQQLRGDAGERQVANAKLALVTNGLAGTCGGMILSRG